MKEKPAIKLRAIEPEDIDLLYQWENDRKIWFISNTIAPFSKYILKQYIESSHQDIYQTRQLRLMLDLINANAHKTIGSIDLFDFDPYHNRAGIGILIADSTEENKGYASLALKELIRYAFETLQLHQLYCNISSDNEKSLHLFKNQGFSIIGIKKEWLKVQGNYIDEYLLQLINSKKS